MMDELKLKHLLARHTVYDIDKLEFSRRIASEHLFQSVDECIDYLYKVIKKTPINPDDPNGICTSTFKSSPILVINIIDEAICTLIYEICQQIHGEDQDFVMYINHRLDELIRYFVQNRPDYDEMINASLLMMLVMVKCLSVPVPHRQETAMSMISQEYYHLMKCLYENAQPRCEYFNKLTAYYKLKSK